MNRILEAFFQLKNNIMDKRVITLDFIFALSLAFIQTLDWWRFLLFTKPSQIYFLEQFGTYHYLGSIFLLLTLSSLIMFGVVSYRKSKSEPMKYFLILLLLFFLINPFNYLRSYFGINLRSIFFTYTDYSIILKIFIAVIFLLLFYSVIKYRKNLNQIGIAVIYFSILLLAPFSIINLFKLTSLSLQNYIPADAVLHISENKRSKKASQRFIWIIFDEMGYRPSFPARPPNLLLPNIDAFSEHAFFSTNAIKPGPDTMESIPSFLTGQHVRKAITKGSSDLIIEYSPDNKPVLDRQLSPKANQLDENFSQFEIDNQNYYTFSQENHLFKKINQDGYASAILGLHHPYCRLFKGLFNKCFPQYIPRQTVYDPISLGNVFRSLVWKLWPFTQDRRREHTKAILNSLKMAEHFVTDSSLDFVFLHFHLPHSPYFYNPETDVVSTSDVYLNYFDNLVLTDKFLGQILQSLKQTELWDSTAILVTSDHGLRKENWPKDWVTESGEEDHRIPFIIRLPNENRGLIFETPHDSIAAKDIALGVLSGEIRNYENIYQSLVTLDENPELFQHLRVK